MIRLRALFSGLALMLALVAALGLVALGGAHRVSKADAAQEFVALTFGDAALCGENGKVAGADCPACHLASAVVLPEPSGLVLAAELRFVAAVILPRAQAAAVVPHDPARPSQGPPTLI